MTFGERLRSIREQKRLKQVDVARLTGIAPSTLSHFERGARHPSLANIEKLVVALHVTADMLIGPSREPNLETLAQPLCKEFADFVNTHSLENQSDTPDFILGEFLALCFTALNAAICRRSMWYGEGA